MTTVEYFQDACNIVYDVLQKQLELACCEQRYCSGEGSFGMYLWNELSSAAYCNPEFYLEIQMCVLPSKIIIVSLWKVSMLNCLFLGQLNQSCRQQPPSSSTAWLMLSWLLISGAESCEMHFWLSKCMTSTDFALSAMTVISSPNASKLVKQYFPALQPLLP